MAEKDTPVLGEKVTSTESGASSVKPSLHGFTGVFHNDEKPPEKPNDAQVDAVPAVDSVRPVGFTELFR